ncbi:Uncharacterised protein [Shewanella morhuae]|uniref:Uncharacterized protein n=1 Tax=Shewanella morhuae TaxID=365591 RepID=A0A380A611_9GAMM|nr:Uncharacterised protein [Shewanella morhuae]
MNQSEDFGKILKPWPNLVDHFNDLNYEYWDIVYGCCSQHLQKQAF